ncbi:MAG: hypothetical protein H7257_14215 [Taibaiella sp.]|nr:hypothetical protein [Taibaiella sp.]
MSKLKEFLSRTTLVNCFSFAVSISVLFAWRHTSTRQIPFFSLKAFQVYLSFVFVSFLVFLFIFFALYSFGKREERH